MRWLTWAAKSVAESRPAAYGKLVVFIGPLLLLIFPALPFANDGHCDPWYVYGLFFNLPDQIHWRPAARQVGRLTETLPGYVLTHTLPSVVSDYVLFLLLFTTATLFLYKAAALLLSPTRGAFVALFFAFSPIVIGNYAATFSGPSLTYEILALYCAARAIRCVITRRFLWWMFLSGIAFGAGLHAHLAVAVFCIFVFLLVAISIFLETERGYQCRLTRIAGGAAATLFGIFVLTAAVSIFVVALWGLQYWSIGLNQIASIPDAIENNATLYWQGDWYDKGPYVGSYLTGIGVAAIGIALYVRAAAANRDGGYQQNRFGFAINMAFAVTMLILLIGESRQGIFLQYDYYYVLLWPFIAIAIFSQPIDERLERRVLFVLLYAVVCCAFVAIKKDDLPSWASDHAVAVSLILATLAIGVLLAQRLTGRTMFVGLYLLALGLLTLGVRPQDMGTQLWDRANRSEWRNSYARINSGLKFLAQTLDNYGAQTPAPKFWVDSESVSDGPAYPRSYLWCGFHPFPEIDTERWEHGLSFDPGDVVVVIAAPRHLFDRVTLALASHGLVPLEISSKTLADEEDGPYEILVIYVAVMQK
jgi:hypothetical protein